MENFGPATEAHLQRLHHRRRRALLRAEYSRRALRAQQGIIDITQNSHGAPLQPQVEARLIDGVHMSQIFGHLPQWGTNRAEKSHTQSLKQARPAVHRSAATDT